MGKSYSVEHRPTRMDVYEKWAPLKWVGGAHVVRFDVSQRLSLQIDILANMAVAGHEPG